MIMKKVISVLGMLVFSFVLFFNATLETKSNSFGGIDLAEAHAICQSQGGEGYVCCINTTGNCVNEVTDEHEGPYYFF